MLIYFLKFFLIDIFYIKNDNHRRLFNKEEKIFDNGNHFNKKFEKFFNNSISRKISTEINTEIYIDKDLEIISKENETISIDSSKYYNY